MVKWDSDGKYVLFPLIKLAKKLKAGKSQFLLSPSLPKKFPLIKLAKKLKELGLQAVTTPILFGFH